MGCSYLCAAFSTVEGGAALDVSASIAAGLEWDRHKLALSGLLGREAHDAALLI